MIRQLSPEWAALIQHEPQTGYFPKQAYKAKDEEEVRRKIGVKGLEIHFACGQWVVLLEKMSRSWHG